MQFMQYAIDGDRDTMWHTQWKKAKPEPPHHIQVDMKKTMKLSGFSYLPRQDNSTIANIRYYEFHVSNDGENWNKVASGRLIATSDLIKIAFNDAVSVRYFKLVSLSIYNRYKEANASEINVLLCPESVTNS